MKQEEKMFLVHKKIFPKRHACMHSKRLAPLPTSFQSMQAELTPLLSTDQSASQACIQIMHAPACAPAMVSPPKHTVALSLGLSQTDKLSLSVSFLECSISFLGCLCPLIKSLVDSQGGQSRWTTSDRQTARQGVGTQAPFQWSQPWKSVPFWQGEMFRKSPPFHHSLSPWQPLL